MSVSCRVLNVVCMNPTFRVRNVTCDYYLSNQTKFVSDCAPSPGTLPVIRVFGITPSGQKCCAHIHGTFPCIWMRTTSRLNSCEKAQLSQMLLHRLQRAQPRLRIPLKDPLLVSVDEIEARNMYGYYENKEPFLKLSFRDPVHVQILTKSLQQEALYDATLQPFYAHIPYVLQVFIEYGIFGMGWIEFSQVYFRKRPKSDEQFESSLLAPTTNVAVEFDAFASDILNPKIEEKCEYSNSGLQYIWQDECARRKRINQSPPVVKSQAEKLAYSTERENEHLARLSQMYKSTSQPGRPTSQTHNPLDMSIFHEPTVYTQVDMNSDVEEQEESMEEQSEEEQDLLEKDSTSSSVSEQSDVSKLSSVVDLDSGNDSSDEDDFSSDEGVVAAEFGCVVRPRGSPIRHAGESNGQVTMRPPRRSFNIAESWADVTVNSRILKPLKRHSSPLKALIKTTSISTVDNLVVMSLEVLTRSISGDIVPNSSVDPIIAVTYALCDDVCNWTHRMDFTCSGGIFINNRQVTRKVDGLVEVTSEYELLAALCKVVQKYDPDVIAGFDLHRNSWTYLVQRAEFLGFPLAKLISRLKGMLPFPDVRDVSETEGKKRMDQTPAHTISKGRVVLEVWKVLRRENPMRSYEFSYCVEQLIGRTHPEIKAQEVQSMLHHINNDMLVAALQLWTERARLDILLLEAVDVFVKASQMARVYGIQFTDVLTRGSQFRVESMLLRIAKRKGLLPPSVGVEQRNRMGSPETIPLNLEPKSAIYRDPVVVLDFQSLYPSVCIAYNYCFTTCLGKISRLEKMHQHDDANLILGALEYCPLPAEQVRALIKNNQVHISPTGSVFVKRSVRRSLLAEMLTELLDTRVMVKDSMKRHKADVHLRRMLDAQQLALKGVANVTYGYTAANWSGRMPCEEVADAIVGKGREALERAIERIKENQEKYRGARVIYGDTDSLFVLFEGRTQEEAFTLGQKIADDVTDDNPVPMKLKFEKVMQPCVLFTKKRYVGMSYEKFGEPGVFDAKGIETVRRDGSPFVSKLMEKCLRILFDEGVSTLVQYLKVKMAHPENYPLSDFVINAEYRGPYSEKAQNPAKKLALEREALCERWAPIRGERLPYVIVKPDITADKAQQKLISCVTSWETFQRDRRLKIHYNYYIGKHLMSTLGRLFSLIPLQLRYRPIDLEWCHGCRRVGQYVDNYCDRCTKSPSILQHRLVESIVGERRLTEARRACQQCFNLDLSVDPSTLPCFSYACSHAQLRLRYGKGMIEKIKRIPITQKQQIQTKLNVTIRTTHYRRSS